MGISLTDWLIYVYFFLIYFFSDLKSNCVTHFPLYLFASTSKLASTTLVWSLLLSRVAWPSSWTSREFPRLLLPLHFIHTSSSYVHLLRHISRCLHHDLLVVISDLAWNRSDQWASTMALQSSSLILCATGQILFAYKNKDVQAIYWYLMVSACTSL